MSTACKGLIPVVLAGALAALLQGCSATPRFDAHFGTSVRTNLASQVIGPDAAVNANPAAGIDGGAARAIHERYVRSFKESSTTQEQPLISGSGSK